MASSSGSPCAACKFLRRKCTAECVFAPYFPPDQPHKFANVHKIFGASNITKLLNELPPDKREDAVNSLAFEADWRMKDPVYGCVGHISVLQRRLEVLICELQNARSDLARYTGMASNGQGPLMPALVPPQQQLNPLVDPVVGALGLHNQQDPTSYSQPLLEQQQIPNFTREQWAEIARVGGGSFEAGLAALGITSNVVVGGGVSSPSPMSTGGLYNSYQRPGSDGASRSSGGSLGHLSPP